MPKSKPPPAPKPKESEATDASSTLADYYAQEMYGSGMAASSNPISLTGLGKPRPDLGYASLSHEQLQEEIAAGNWQAVQENSKRALMKIGVMYGSAQPDAEKGWASASASVAIAEPFLSERLKTGAQVTDGGRRAVARRFGTKEEREDRDRLRLQWYFAEKRKKLNGRTRTDARIMKDCPDKFRFGMSTLTRLKRKFANRTK